MAEVLKTFLEGEDILASETNANNQFLLGKISDNAERLQNFVDGEITSIQSNLASAQATLQNSINELTETVNNGLGNVYENIAPNMSAGISITNGWTATASGWLNIIGSSDASGNVPTAYIDGKEVYRNHQSAGDGRAGSLWTSSMAFIGKGQVFTTSGRGTTNTFYPCKGVQDA